MRSFANPMTSERGSVLVAWGRSERSPSVQWSLRNLEKISSGITYEGTFFRVIKSNHLDNAWSVGAENIGKSHRYSDIGRGAVYTSTSKEALMGEVRQYQIVSNEVKIDKILDLTNSKTRTNLGIKLEQITSDDYFLTQALGDFARTRYQGALVPSARELSISNLVIFGDLKLKFLCRR